MAEPFIASVQYGDFKGTVAADLFDTGLALPELAKQTKMPAGYFPVGLELNRLKTDKDGQIEFTVFAVDAREIDFSITGIIEMAEANAKAGNDELELYPFPGKIAPLDLIAMFKRFDLKLVNKNLTRFNVVGCNAP